MEELIKLATTAMDTYSVGQDIYNRKYQSIKRDMLMELSKISGVIGTLLVLFIAMFAFLTAVVIGCSRLVSYYYDNAWIEFLTPAALTFAFASIIWLNRKKMHIYFTRKVITELLD